MQTLTQPDTTLIRGQEYPRITTLFCDFDGPIVDVSDRYHRTYRLGLARTRRYYRDQGQRVTLSPLSKTQFWNLKQHRVPDAEIALRSGLQGEQIDYFRNQVLHWVNHPALLRCDRVQPGVHWALSLLHHQHIRLVLVTLRAVDQVQDFLQRHQLQGYFSGIYGTANDSFAYTNYAEVKTTLLRQALAESDRLPNQWYAMVGDTEADVWAAQAVNIPAIALTCGIRSHAYLQRLNPEHIENNLLLCTHQLLCQKNLGNLSNECNLRVALKQSPSN